MKKNGLLQTFVYVFWKFNWQITDRLKKWKREHRQYMAPRFFYQKGHGIMKKGKGAAPFYFSLDKTLKGLLCNWRQTLPNGSPRFLCRPTAFFLLAGAVGPPAPASKKKSRRTAEKSRTNPMAMVNSVI